MFSPQYAVKPYDTYFKILYTDDAESRWYEVTVRNDTPKDGTFYTDADMVKEGDALVITAVPEDGYVVRTLEVNGSQVEMDSDNTYTVQNVRKNIEITGNFRLANADKTDEEHLEYSALVTSDFTSNWEDLEGIMRDWEPDKSAAGTGKGWGNWPQQGGQNIMCSMNGKKLLRWTVLISTGMMMAVIRRYRQAYRSCIKTLTADGKMR
ncbi:MAG: hypothetical protein V8S28_00355 [Lachnospiraceae bacterium]